MGNQILDEHWREQWPGVDGGRKISTQRDDLLLLKREEQLFQSLGQRMDDNKGNELIAVMDMVIFKTIFFELFILFS